VREILIFDISSSRNTATSSSVGFSASGGRLFVARCPFVSAITPALVSFAFFFEVLVKIGGAARDTKKNWR